MKRHKIWFFVPIAVLVLCMLLFGGTPGGQAVPEVPSAPAWFVAPADITHAGVPVLFLDEEEATAFFEERLRDRDVEMFFGVRGFGGVASVVPSAPGIIPIRELDLEDEYGEGGGMFLDSGDSADRTGWGWLVDDVRHLTREAGGVDAGGEVDWRPRLREENDSFRMGQFGEDDSFRRRRWLDE